MHHDVAGPGEDSLGLQIPQVLLGCPEAEGSKNNS